MAEPIAQTKVREQLHRLLPPGGPASGREERDQDVVDGGEVADQIERLEDEAHMVMPEPSCSSSVREVMSQSSTRIVPEVGRSSVPSSVSKVLLPEPEGPTMKAQAPLGTSKRRPAALHLVLSRAEVLVTSRTSIMAAGAPVFDAIQCVPLRIASMGTSPEARQAG